MVRTRTGRGQEGEKGEVGLLVELFRLYGNRGLTEESPLMSFRGFRGNESWLVSSRGRANQCSRDVIGSVGKRWREKDRGAGAGLIPNECALHSRRIGGAKRLAASGVPEAVI